MLRTLMAISVLVVVVGGARAESQYDRPGFVTFQVDGRLWIFRDFSAELGQHRAGADIEQFVTKVGAGPDKLTVRAPDFMTIASYLAAKPGFETAVTKSAVWVFRADSPAISTFAAALTVPGAVTRPDAGPLGLALKAPDEATIDAYLSARQ